MIAINVDSLFTKNSSDSLSNVNTVKSSSPQKLVWSCVEMLTLPNPHCYHHESKRNGIVNDPSLYYNSSNLSIIIRVRILVFPILLINRAFFADRSENAWPIFAGGVDRLYFILEIFTLLEKFQENGKHQNSLFAKKCNMLADLIQQCYDQKTASLPLHHRGYTTCCLDGNLSGLETLHAVQLFSI